jgi:hypothetical protein
MSKKTLMFENGDAEMWCDWRIEFGDLIRLAPLITAEHKTNAALTLFKGKALPEEQKFYEFLMLPKNISQSHTPIAGSASTYATILKLLASLVFSSLWLVSIKSMFAFRTSPESWTRKAQKIVVACQTMNFMTSLIWLRSQNGRSKCLRSTRMPTAMIFMASGNASNDLRRQHKSLLGNAGRDVQSIRNVTQKKEWQW